MTGTPPAAATAAVASAFTPVSMPSRSMSVNTMAKSGKCATLAANSTAPVWLVSSQPAVAARPARASRPRITRPGKRSAMAARNGGSSIARVPTMTWLTPASR